MRKIIFWSAWLAVIALASCIKPLAINPLTQGSSGGGTWTFAGVTDTATSCIYDTGSGTYSATAASNFSSRTSSNYTTIRCGYNEKLVAGTYTVVPVTVNPTGNQMNFEIDYGLGGLNGSSWYSTGAPGQTVNVSISGGKITIAGSGIQIYQVPAGTPNASDTSTLALNIYASYY